MAKCQNGHKIVPCDCGGTACPGYVHPAGGIDIAGHYCQAPVSGAWVKIKSSTGGSPR